MGTFLIPDENNSFKELLSDDIFIDKTDFIAEIAGRIDRPNKLVAFTKPRRFGKTVTADMLSSFFSRGANAGSLFENRTIAGLFGEEKAKNENGQEITVKYRYTDRHLNKHHVICIDMNAVNGLFYRYLQNAPQKNGVTDLVDFLEYSVISEFKSIPEFRKILESNEIENTGLFKALIELNNAPELRARFIFIMDEWDLIYREYRDNETLQIKFIDMLKGLFKTGDGLACFSLAYLTGILPIKKYNSQSALNTFYEFNMLTPGNFAPWFGFTEEDVAGICRLPVCAFTQNVLREWYEGYKIQIFDRKTGGYKEVDVYNPNSVCRAVSRSECTGYWGDSSSDEEFIRLVNMNLDGIKDDILRMIAGDSVKFNFKSFKNDMVSIKNKNQVFSLMVCLGYLGCSGKDGTERLAYVPNKEIRESLSELVRDQPWFNSMPVIQRSEKLFQAIRSLDAAKTAEIIGDIHNSPYVSVIGYNKEEALVFCLISGLMWCAGSSYDSYRELPAGKGFADLVFVPKSGSDLPILITEFKRDYSAEDALNQIKKQDYAARYRKNGDDREVLLIGLNYSSETKEHQCVIEKM